VHEGDLHIPYSRIIQHDLLVLGNVSIESGRLTVLGSNLTIGGNGTAVEGSGTLEITNGMVAFNTTGTISITGRLVLTNAVLKNVSSITVRSGSVDIDHCTLDSDIYVYDSEVSVTYSTLNGNMDVHGSQVAVRDSEITGHVTFWDSNVTLRDSSASQVTVNGGEAVIRESTVSTLSTSGNIVHLQNTTYQDVNAAENSTVSVEWEVTVRVLEPDGTPMFHALIEVSDPYNESFRAYTVQNGEYTTYLAEKEISGGTTVYRTPYAVEYIGESYSGEKVFTFSSSCTVTLQLSAPTPAPNLKIVGISTIPEKPFSRGNVILSAMVGATDVTSYTVVKACMKDELTGDSGVMTLTVPEGDSTLYVNFTLYYVEGGDHPITVTVDCYDVLSESDEEDNTMEYLMTVSNSSSELPDLMVVSIAGDSTPSVGDTSEYRIKISNIGYSASAGTSVRVTVDGRLLDTCDIGELSPGESTYCTVEFTPDSAGVYSMEVMVDPENSVEEVSEENNYAYQSIHAEEDILPLDDTTSLICCMVVIPFLIVVLVAIISYISKKRKQQKATQQTSTVVSRPSAGRELSVGTKATSYGTPTGSPEPTVLRPARVKTPPPPSSGEPSAAGGLTCPRCGGHDIIAWPDGHRKCNTCKKIFFQSAGRSK